MPISSRDSGTSVVSLHGVRMPGIVYGTAWKKAATEALVVEALGQGFRGLDTAGQPKHYDEAGVGRGIEAALADGLKRESLYVQTKFTPFAGQDPGRMPYDPRARPAEQVAQSFETSLTNLRTSHVECLVLHSPLREPDEMAEVWGAMETIVDEGGARQLGISNCYDAADLARLFEAARVKPAVVQNRFYAQTGYDREIRAFCRQHGIIYQSFWTLTANAHVLEHADVAAIAARHERTPAQVLFRYLTHERVVPLTGTTSLAHMREALAIFEFELAASERAVIAALLGG